jgi:hypothetical protein
MIELRDDENGEDMKTPNVCRNVFQPTLTGIQELLRHPSGRHRPSW